MSDYQARVKAERSELFHRTRKISLFLQGEGLRDLDRDEISRLYRQEAAMLSYLHILDERIENFS